MAGLGGVNESYKEASQIDGANAWIIFWKITMPQLYPTIFYVLVTSVIGSMQIYVEPSRAPRSDQLSAHINYISPRCVMYERADAMRVRPVFL